MFFLPDEKKTSISFTESPLFKSASDRSKELLKTIYDVFENHNVEIAENDVFIGPSFTRFDFKISKHNIKFLKTSSLVGALNTKVNAINIIFNSFGLSFDVPNDKLNVIYSGAFNLLSPYSFYIGYCNEKGPIEVSLDECQHILVAGSHKSGKTTFLKHVITSLFLTNTPKEINFKIADLTPAKSLACFNELPHLLCPVLTEKNEFNTSLNEEIEELEKRYEKLEMTIPKTQNIDKYNEIVAKLNKGDLMPRRIVVINGLEGFFRNYDNFYSSLIYLAQKGRDVGIHLIVTTDYLSSSSIVETLKGGFPTRISFRTKGELESFSVVGKGDAKHLSFEGEAFVNLPFILDSSDSKTNHIQTYFIDTPTIKKVVSDYSSAKYNEPELFDLFIREKVQIPLFNFLNLPLKQRQIFLEDVLTNKISSIDEDIINDLKSDLNLFVRGYSNAQKLVKINDSFVSQIGYKFFKRVRNILAHSSENNLTSTIAKIGATFFSKKGFRLFVYASGLSMILSKKKLKVIFLVFDSFSFTNQKQVEYANITKALNEKISKLSKEIGEIEFIFKDETEKFAFSNKRFNKGTETEKLKNELEYSMYTLETRKRNLSLEIERISKFSMPIEDFRNRICVKSISINDFCGLRDVFVNFENNNNISIFHGDNGFGKTTILSYIKDVKNLFGLFDADDENYLEDNAAYPKKLMIGLLERLFSKMEIAFSYFSLEKDGVLKISFNIDSQYNALRLSVQNNEECFVTKEENIIKLPSSSLLHDDIQESEKTKIRRKLLVDIVKETERLFNNSNKNAYLETSLFYGDNLEINNENRLFEDIGKTCGIGSLIACETAITSLNGLKTTKEDSEKFAFLSLVKILSRTYFKSYPDGAVMLQSLKDLLNYLSRNISRNKIEIGDLSELMARMNAYFDIIEKYVSLSHVGLNNMPLFNFDEIKIGGEKYYQCVDKLFSFMYFGKEEVLFKFDALDDTLYYEYIFEFGKPLIKYLTSFSSYLVLKRAFEHLTIDSEYLLSIDGNELQVLKPSSLEKNSFIPFKIEQLSEGERRSLEKLWQICHRDFQKYTNPIVLIDEPEQSLHIEWQMRFIDSLLQIKDDMEKFKILFGVGTFGQVIVATHSPFVLSGHENLDAKKGDK